MPPTPSAPPCAARDDAELLAALRGDASAREGAIAELRAILLRGLARGLAGRYGDAVATEDIVQESLLRILASLDKFEGRSRFVTWAMTVATRVGISMLRRKHTRDVSLDAYEDAAGARQELAIDRGPTASAEQQRSELLAQLRQLVDSELTDKQRAAVEAFLNGHSTDTIAERTGADRNAVYKLLHDARTRLKQGFARVGVTASDVKKVLA